MSISEIPKIEGIDHVHIYVADRAVAEKWYADTLGYQRVDKFEVWATDAGPLTLVNAEGNVHLAVFQRDNPIPSNVLAFGAVGSEFIRWVSYLRGANTDVALKDHDLSISLYFEDRDQNVLEITTYDHEVVRSELRMV